jgi:hypothetical protein
MKAKKPNQIREEVRKQVAAQYKEEIERLKKLAATRWENYMDAMKRLAETHDENIKLKEQVSAQQDWIERLMEFIDMPEDERHDAIQKYIANRKMSEDFAAMFGPYFKVLNRLSLL